MDFTMIVILFLGVAFGLVVYLLYWADTESDKVVEEYNRLLTEVHKHSPGSAARFHAVKQLKEFRAGIIASDIPGIDYDDTKGGTCE